MQKIGINKCKNKILNYSNTISQSKTLNLNNLNLNQIFSTIINTTVLDTHFCENISSFKILFKSTIKITYSRFSDNSLYIYDKSFLNVDYIHIPKVIEGTPSNNAFIQNKLKAEIFIENISTKLISPDKLLLNYYLVTNLIINPVFYLAYVINNCLFDNIFLSYSDGQNLTQKTFTSDLTYTDIIWQPDSQKLAFIGVKENHSSIYLIDSNPKNKFENNSIIKNILENVNICKNVNNFTFKNNNEVIFVNQENNNDIIYMLNFKRNSFKKISSNDTNIKYTKLYFDKKSNNLYCLSLIDNINCFCSFDQNYNFEILFNFVNVLDYIISHNSNNVVLKISKDNINLLYSLNKSNKMLNPLYLDFEYDDILKFRFFLDKNSKEMLVIQYLINHKKYLALYDLSTFESKIVHLDDPIDDFDIDFYTNDIFIVSNNNKFSKIIKVTSNKIECILKIPGTIKSLTIKKN